MDSTSKTPETGSPTRNHSLLGVIILWSGAILGILLFCEKMGGLPFSMPASWYSYSSIWLVLAIILFGTGIKLISDSKPDDTAWSPVQKYQRFKHVAIFSREDCQLCHEAEELLASYHEYIPIPEIIDIDGNEELETEFGNCVPVVVIDGKIRFRGKIEEELLQRLIENSPVTHLPVIEK